MRRRYIAALCVFVALAAATFIVDRFLSPIVEGAPPTPGRVVEFIAPSSENEEGVRPVVSIADGDPFVRLAPEKKVAAEAFFPRKPGRPAPWQWNAPYALYLREYDAFILLKKLPPLEGLIDARNATEDENTLVLDECSLVWFPRPKEEKPAAARVLDAFVISVSGVELKFAKALNRWGDWNAMLSMEFWTSAFVMGRVTGNTTIDSKMGTEDPSDDLAVSLGQFRFDGKQIKLESGQLCGFKYGESAGQAEEITVYYRRPAAIATLGARDVAPTRALDGKAWRESVASLVAEGNLGGGFSIEQVEINKFTSRSFYRPQTDGAEKPVAEDGAEDEAVAQNA
ncbi:MAG: hypothetical protein HUK22_00565, partial [Thermoguttaceae bacterium]|nr:hypothetical protein [Thermoguttaceae bacterium]